MEKRTKDISTFFLIPYLVLFMHLIILLPFNEEMMVSGAPPPTSPYFRMYLPNKVDSDYGSMAHWVNFQGYVDCEIPGTKPPGTQVEIKLVLEIECVNNLIFTGVVEKGKSERLDYEFGFQMDGTLPGGSIIPFMVSGTWSYLPPNDGSGEIGTFDSSVYISRFLELRMGMTEWDDEIDFFIDQWYEFGIHIYNAGNIDCRFSIRVLDIPDDMQIELDTEEMYLGPFESKVIDCRIKQFGGTPFRGKFTIRTVTHPAMDVRFENSFEFRIQSYEGEGGNEISSGVAAVIVGSGFVLVFFIVMVVFFIRLRSQKNGKDHRSTDIISSRYDQNPPPEGPCT